MLRIVAGRARGLKLQVLEGISVRPTADRVREAVFSALQCRRSFEGLHVLDLFAGAGGLGLEALSRGASEVVFVEKDRDVARILQENLDHVSKNCEGSKGRIVKLEVQSFLNKAMHQKSAKYDVVFLDPPYALDLLTPALAALSPILAPDAVVCAEYELKAPPVWPSDCEVWWQRDYGRTGVALLSPFAQHAEISSESLETP